MIPFLAPGARFPPVERALRRPDGLLAAGGDLSVARWSAPTRTASSRGSTRAIPILWWSPNPRMVLPCAEFHRLADAAPAAEAATTCAVSLDGAFTEVRRRLRGAARRRGRHLARPGDAGGLPARCTRAGCAHSVEVWRGEQLVGGLYGVALGRMFFGESMVARRDRRARRSRWPGWRRRCSSGACRSIDCQMATPHLASLGARGGAAPAVHRVGDRPRAPARARGLALRRRPRPCREVGNRLGGAGKRLIARRLPLRPILAAARRARATLTA